MVSRMSERDLSGVNCESVCLFRHVLRVTGDVIAR